MDTIWILTEVKGTCFEIHGVFSSKELAMALCSTDEHCVVPFRIDHDYTKQHMFVAYTRNHPEGILTGG